MRYQMKRGVLSAVEAVAVDRMSDDYKSAVLAEDLFAGDFGDGSERVIVDEVRVVKRRGICRECLGPIRKGEVCRVVKMVDREGFYGGRCCQDCCDAMASADYDAMDYRHSLRRERQNARGYSMLNADQDR